MRAKLAAAVGGICIASLAMAPGASATMAPPQSCGNDMEIGHPASELTDAPWPQLRLNFTDAWRFTKGEHVKVAVVDSGVDDAHRQLPRIDQVDVTGTGTRDCTGHGTMVAGIIAAQDLRGEHIPFLGVAPRAHVISVKVAVQDDNNDPAVVAKGIKRAANLGAKIINVSIQAVNFPVLKDAVVYAQARGALIVAAAGNIDPQRKESEQQLYPAKYNGVISVGAVGRDGKLGNFSNGGSDVSVVAPGAGVTSTWPGNTYNGKDGTSFAAPYVTATAALVKSYYPRLTAQQIKHRIEATADGGTAVGSGHGMVNPLRAVTAVLPEENSAAGPPVRPHPVALIQPHRQNPFTRRVATSVIAGSLGIAFAIAAGGLIIPAGRRRGWRPGRRATSASADE